MIDAESNEKIYSYDEVGNLLSVEDRPVSGLSIAITDFEPKEGTAGTVVVIYGKGFSATAANNTVKFGNLQAAVALATATKLTVTVPAGAVTGRITVQNKNATATSAEDFRVALPVASLAVQPEVVFLFPGNTQRFRAFADGVETKKVRWSIEGAAGGNASYGTITQMGGLYQAPALTSTDEVTITATCLASPQVSGQARVILNPAAVSRPVNVAFGPLPSQSRLSSLPVSVGLVPIPEGTGLSSRPVSVLFPPAVGPLTSRSATTVLPQAAEGTLVSRPVALQWPTLGQGLFVSQSVCVKISAN